MTATLTGLDEKANGPDKNRLPNDGFDLAWGAADTESPVFSLKSFRGIGVNLPALSTVTSVKLHVSNKIDGDFAEHAQIEFVPDTVNGVADSNSFIAEWQYGKLVLDLAEGSTWTSEQSLS